jgi:hypothetical protein
MKYLLAIIILFSVLEGNSQGRVRGMADRMRGMGGGGGGGGEGLAKRNRNEDSISISYRYLDTTRAYRLDSSIDDFYKRFPIPSNYYYLGNTGNAAQSYIFSPRMKAGWDAGFHAYDVYRATVEKARFFTTTRPYSELNYLIGSRTEQYIEVLHTQNIKPNWNAHFQYRFINSPGMFLNQKTNHNNYLLTNWVQSKNKRYNNYFILAANKLGGSENGGLVDTLNYLDDPIYSDRLYIPTKLGEGTPYGRNFFNTKINTGNKYNDFSLVMRQQYDFGRKDSIVTDSTVVPLFFPRVRLEHTISRSKYTYIYTDVHPSPAAYETFFKLTLPGGNNPFELKDQWKRMVNDFSIYTFPDEKNTQQFIKLGAALENLSGSFDTLVSNKQYMNVYGHGEYRNRTKNQKWDLLANGVFYFAGYNIGDYEARASIQSLLGKKIGSIQLGFENVSRKPSFITNSLSAFHLMKDEESLRKENTIHLFANLFQPLLKLGLGGHYYLMNNYVYYTDFYQVNQYGSLFNILQVNANKVFETGRKKQWKWRSDVYFQQAVGNAPVHVPLVFTRNRFAYEGTLGYPNLNIAFGFDTRYHTAYKANNYSPVNGQFFYQDSVTTRYRLPDISAYLNFRINSFKAFIRADNLNTFGKLGQNYGFYDHNFAIQGYPYPGLVIRVGVFWGFVN